VKDGYIIWKFRSFIIKIDRFVQLKNM